MDPSSDGREPIDKNEGTQFVVNNNPKLSTDLKAEYLGPNISDKMLTEDTQIKNSSKAMMMTTTPGSKINLQNVPFNTPNVIKNIQTPTLASPMTNIAISNVYNMMLNHHQQQPIGNGISGGLKSNILSQPNIPLVTMMSGVSGNGNTNVHATKGSSKIVITNSGGVNPNSGQQSTRIITTSAENLPKTMPSNLKSSIITSSGSVSSNSTSSSSINIKSISPMAFTSVNDTKTNLIKTPSIKQLTQSIVSPQTQTVQLVNNITNFSSSNIMAIGQSSTQFSKQHKIPTNQGPFVIPQLISPVQTQSQNQPNIQQQPRQSNVINFVDNNTLTSTQNLVHSLELNSSSSPSINTISPSSSPLKPNIIRKSRRDTPSASSFNLTTISIPANDPIYNIHQNSIQNSLLQANPTANTASITTIKNQTLELSQDSIKNITVSTVIPSLSVSSNCLPTSLASSLVGIDSLSNSNKHYFESSSINSDPLAPLKNKTQQIPKEKLLNQGELSQLTAASVFLPTSLTHSIPGNKCSIESREEIILDSSALKSSRKKRKQEFKTLDINVGFNENPLAIKRPNLNDYGNSLIDKFSDTENARNQEFKKSNGSKATTEETSLKTYSFLTPLTKQHSIVSHKNFSIDNSPETITTPVQSEQKNDSRSKVNSIMIGNQDTQGNSIKIEIDSNDETSNSESMLDEDTLKYLSREFSYVSPEGAKWVTKKPRFSIWNSCLKNKRIHNHLNKYSDVKNKNSKQENLTKMIQFEDFDKDLNHWKLYYVTSHIKNHITYENESVKLVNEIESIIQKFEDINGLADITFKISESIKANNQRHKCVNEQLDESLLLLKKLIEHKDNYRRVTIQPNSCNQKFSKLPQSSKFSSATFVTSKLKRKSIKKSSTAINKSNYKKQS